MMPMDASDVRQFRVQLGLTQAAFAELVGVDSNSIARWERGAVRVPEPAARLMRLLAFLAADEAEASAAPKTRSVPGARQQFERATLAATALSPLADFAAGRGSERAARDALRTLRQRGRRGRV